PQSTHEDEDLFNHITQYSAYLDDVEVDHVQEDTPLSSILVWALIGGAATKIAKQYEDILPMKKAYDDSSTTYTPTHYWHSTMHFRRNWSTGDRKSTRLNSSHVSISYAVFCLKKKKH